MEYGELEKTISIAHKAMSTRPDKALLPIYRRMIYRMLDLDNSKNGHNSFKWLAIATARHVLPIWNSVRSKDPMPNTLIDMAEKVMDGKLSVDLIQGEASKAWKYLEDLGVAEEEKALGSAYYSGEAAVEALMEVLGKDPFKEITIDEKTTDPDLDPWCSDTALWGAAAFAGRVGDVNSDLEKRRAFWDWWLRIAIPTAVKLASRST